MREEVRRLLGEELANYLELLRAKMAFAEELYGVKMNYVPLAVGDEIVIFDRNDGAIKWLRDKKPLTADELKLIADTVKRNLESGYVEMLLTMHMGCINGPGE